MAVALATLPLKRLAAEAEGAFWGIAAGAGFAAGLAGVVFATATLMTARGWAAGLETGLADATAFFAGGTATGLAVFTTGFAAEGFLADAAVTEVFTVAFLGATFGATGFFARMAFFGCCLTTVGFAAVFDVGFFAATGLAAAFFAAAFFTGFAAGAFFAGILLALFTAIPFF